MCGVVVSVAVTITLLHFRFNCAERLKDIKKSNDRSWIGLLSSLLSVRHKLCIFTGISITLSNNKNK